jgi:Cu+-exporting ATPase
MASVHLEVTGMTCDHCRKRVEDALNAVAGVYGAFVDLGEGVAEVDHDATVDTEALVAAVKNAGYDATPTG